MKSEKRQSHLKFRVNLLWCGSIEELSFNAFRASSASSLRKKGSTIFSIYECRGAPEEKLCLFKSRLSLSVLNRYMKLAAKSEQSYSHDRWSNLKNILVLTKMYAFINAATVSLQEDEKGCNNEHQQNVSQKYFCG